MGMSDNFEQYAEQDSAKCALNDAPAKLNVFRKAFYEVTKYLRQIEAYQREVNQSRFYRLDAGAEDCLPQLVRVTESDVSSHYDLADCHDDDTSKFFWLADDGQMHEVKTGKMERFDNDEEYAFHFAGADLIAAGQVVGSVTYTDH